LPQDDITASLFGKFSDSIRTIDNELLLYFMSEAASCALRLNPVNKANNKNFFIVKIID
jgi:hypothetical protein